MEKIYRVQINKHGMPNFSTAEEIEPNLLIVPETIERGCETYIGENIVVVHHDDFIDIKCKAMMWDEYGEEPKQGEWIYPTDIIGFGRCGSCGSLWDKSLIDNIYISNIARGADRG